VSTENIENASQRSDVSLFGGASSASLLGTKVGGRWEIVELLGEGNMSTVFRAEEASNKKVVALKLIHKHLVKNISNLPRFEQRARALIALNHEHISNFYDINITEGKDIFLFCDYFPSENLEEILSKVGHIGIDRAAKIFKQASDGLDYAHKQKILHRDLKPSNICVVNDQYSVDDVRLVDFGITRLLVEESSDSKGGQFQTHSREVFGSALYMSPEQCAGKKVDARSDIYALGCIMYECINGKPPFVGKNVMETAYKHMNEAPPKLVSSAPTSRTFERYQQILNKALQKSPDRRYQNMSELKHDLDIIADANDAKWQSAAFALKGGGKIAFRSITETNIPWGWIAGLAGIVALLGVIGYWAFSLLSDDLGASEYPRYDVNKIWVMTDKKAKSSVEDFSTKRENARIELEAIEQEKTKNSKEYELALKKLCDLFHEANRWADLTVELKQLIEIQKNVHGPIRLSQVYSDLALAYFMQNENEAAEKFANLALQNDVDNKNNSGTREAKRQALNILGDIYTQKEDNKRALDSYLELYTINDSLRAYDQAGFGKASAELADAYRRLGDYDNCNMYYRRAEYQWSNFVTKRDEFRAKCDFAMALAAEGKKEYAKAQSLLKGALPSAITFTGPKSGLVGAIRKEYLDNLYHLAFWYWVKVKLKPDDDPVLRSPDADTNQKAPKTN
jgi:serine/threonine protein kinase